MTDADGPAPGARRVRLRRRSGDQVRGAVARARGALALAGQAGLAAGIAWYVAHDVIGNPAPFFAPIAAVITLAVSVGQRLRRTAELVAGVALGIAVGDLLVLMIGTGPWQLGLMVALAVVVAVALGGGSALVVQAAASAVLVATLTPTGGPPYARFVDALVGGLVGLAVMALLLPLNPLTVVRRAAEPALVALADGLHEVAAALTEGDVRRAEAVLTRLRAADATFAAFADAVHAARENSLVAPARRRSRPAIAQYVDAADHLGYALRNVRVLVRRVRPALADREPVPPALPAAVRLLGDAVTLLRRELADGVEPQATRERALRAAVEVGGAYPDRMGVPVGVGVPGGVGFSGGVVVAQVRSTVVDLLRATGIEYGDALRMLRHAAGRHGRARPGRAGERRSAAGDPPQADEGT